MSGSGEPRVLVAALGSTLRGDDGFGPVLLTNVRRLLPEGVEGADFGSHGIALVQKLYEPFDALVLLDACVRGGLPGTVYVLEPDVPAAPAAAAMATLDALADVHVTDPDKVLMLARELQVLPSSVWLVGCEPDPAWDYVGGLSDAASRALAPAAQALVALLGNIQRAHAVGRTAQ